ncbi:hypothetical protein [Cohnella rhizosphaerae]|uniref:Uncharacterized protein n=1 Tax=Cohnella rhizosphaerae TaxID=1457232 RepID=A0A9X4QVR3_9BACL|nr:hypothetical protein [Cohnella rhizosphaerae]MDG0811722.1 hypothetical protein [Cohnella rhizosphaerae]
MVQMALQAGVSTVAAPSLASAKRSPWLLPIELASTQIAEL